MKRVWKDLISANWRPSACRWNTDLHWNRTIAHNGQRSFSFGHSIDSQKDRTELDAFAPSEWVSARRRSIHLARCWSLLAFDFPLFYRVRTSPLSLSHARALLSKQYLIDLHVWGFNVIFNYQKLSTISFCMSCWHKKSQAKTSIMPDDSPHALSWWEEEISELSSHCVARQFWYLLLSSWE